MKTILPFKLKVNYNSFIYPNNIFDQLKIQIIDGSGSVVYNGYVIANNEYNDNYYIYVWDATWHWVWAWFIMVMVNALISAMTKVLVSWDQILTRTRA